ncbi:hypothetical protein OTU49_016977, partial [Cherax quadricarinatus]
FIVVCTDDTEASKLMNDSSIRTLQTQQFTLSPSPFLKSKRSVFVKRLDNIVTSLSTEALKTSIEEQNTWASVDSISKISNASFMLKITFSDVSMAAQALSDGLAISYYHIHPSHIEQERFTYISHCWTCYSYKHTTKDCPVKDKKFCSKCGNDGHDFRSCTITTAPSCLNCKGNHHTLAAKCPLRKEIIVKKTKVLKNTSNSPTYAAMTKPQTDTTKTLHANLQ